MNRKKTVASLAFFMAAGLLLAAPSAVKKYDVKSGIITMDSVMKMGSMEIKTMLIVYFDDYGVKECKETYLDGKLNGSIFSDGKFKYSLDFDKKTATKTEDGGGRGTELQVDINFMASKKDIDSGKVKIVAPMTIAGKQCEVIEADTGSITQYGGWKKVMVYMKMTSKSVSVLTKATKIEENAKVPAEKFKLPAGFTVKS